MTEESIFTAALERTDTADRLAFLDHACAGDVALRGRIESLLASHESPHNFLRQSAPEQLAINLSGIPDRAEGTLPGHDARRGDHEPPPIGESVLRLLEPSRRPDGLGRILHYEVLKVLGVGGFGTVLKVFDESLQRVVAIKVLAPELAVSGAARERFLREARAAATVRHDNVINIHGVGNDPTPYLVMEFIEGPTLQQKLDRVGPLPLKEILRIGMQTAEGLAAAHKQGLIHRDIKPSNILLENGIERVKISDFGLARAVNDASLTQSGLIAGTPQYMSPEQAEGSAVDQRSDLFSLGSVLYALCTGRPPFRAESTMAVLRRVCEHPARSIREINPEIPEWLVALIEKLHAKAPADRYQSAAEVAERLAKQLSHLQLGTAPTDFVVKRTVNQKAPRSGGWTAKSTAVVLLSIAFLAGAGWAWLHFVGRPDPEISGLVKSDDKTPLVAAAELARRSSPADNLNRKDIFPTLLANAGQGDPAKAPADLVAILGDGRFLHREGGNRHGGVMDCAFSPDGKSIASVAATMGETFAFTRWDVKLWDSATGRPVRDFSGHADSPRAVAFSPDGKRLATAGMEGIVRVFNTATAEIVFELKGHTGAVRSVAWSSDGLHIASGSSDRTVVVWEAVEGRRKSAFDKHLGEVLHVAFSADGQRVVSTAGNGENAVRVWETETGKELGYFPRSNIIPRASAFSRDGNRVVTVGEEPIVRVWNVATNELVSELQGHTDWVLSVAVSRDGKHYATASLDGTIRIWDAAAGKEQHVGAGHFLFPTTVAFDSDGKRLASGDCSGRIKLWDVATGRSEFAQHAGSANAVAMSADGTLLVSGGEDKTVRLWDPASGALRHTLAGHQNPVTSVAVSSNGKQLASASLGVVKIWDVAQAKELFHLTDQTGDIRQVAFAADGKMLASVGLDGTVCLWDPAAGKLVKTLTGKGPSHCLAISPDGQTLAAGEKNAIRLWDVASGWESGTLLGHSGTVRSLTFHPDGASLASSAETDDSSIRIWDWRNRKETQRLDGNTAGVVSCVWRADGGLLATCGGDGTLRLWDTTRHPPLSRTLPGFVNNSKSSQAIALSPEGRYLATANADGTLFLFKLAERGKAIGAAN